MLIQIPFDFEEREEFINSYMDLYKACQLLNAQYQSQRVLNALERANKLIHKVMLEQVKKENKKYES